MEMNASYVNQWNTKKPHRKSRHWNWINLLGVQTHKSILHFCLSSLYILYAVATACDCCCLFLIWFLRPSMYVCVLLLLFSSACECVSSCGKSISFKIIKRQFIRTVEFGLNDDDGLKLWWRAVRAVPQLTPSQTMQLSSWSANQPTKKKLVCSRKNRVFYSIQNYSAVNTKRNRHKRSRNKCQASAWQITAELVYCIKMWHHNM